MPMQVIDNAMCQCMFGVAPSTLMVLPINMDMTFSMPAATMNDHIPFLNVLPFGMCQTMSNPMVAAATAAALGVLTPMPCLPMTMSPWVPPCPTVMIKNTPSIDNSAMLNCMWGGMIQINFAGQATTMIP